MRRQTRDKIWDEFVHWCKKRHLKPLPAHPWTIAAYLRWMDTHHDGENAEKALKSISRAHLLAGRRSPHNHPMIERTLGSIYRRRSTAPDRSDLFEAKDFLASSVTHPVPAQDNDDAEDEEEDTQIPPITRRQTMRSQPRLVSRRRM